MELSAKQLEILNAPYNKIVVMSSAAAGKSKLQIEKVRQLLHANYNPNDIAVITFTNMAASELKLRLGTDYTNNLFVGTIHSLANQMLIKAGIKTDKILNDEDFDKLFNLVKENPHCIKHYEWILLDEAQDSDQLQFDFLFKMINPECFFVTGDCKQSIYGWKGALPKLLMNLAKQPNVHCFSLDENYRNGSSILSYAQRIIKPTGLIDSSYSVTGEKGIVEEIPYNLYDIACFVQKDTYKDWAILCRTNQEVQTIYSYLDSVGLPVETFKQGDLKREELVERMNANTIKILTVHAAKGLEWNNIITVGMRFWKGEERNICYVAVTRAKEKLIWMYYPKKQK